jgi:hypothetical protein
MSDEKRTEIVAPKKGLSKSQSQEKKDIIAVLAFFVSCCALFFSGVTTYYNVIRQTDHLSVAVDSIPTLSFDLESSEVTLTRDLSLLFINSGTRAVAIRYVGIKLASRLEQPTRGGWGWYESAKSSNKDNNAHFYVDRGCDGPGKLLSVENDAFVIQAKEVTSKRMQLGGAKLDKSVQVEKDRLKIIVARAPGESYGPTVCLIINVTTPSAFASRVIALYTAGVSDMGESAMPLLRGDDVLVWSQTRSIFSGN